MGPIIRVRVDIEVAWARGWHPVGECDHLTEVETLVFESIVAEFLSEQPDVTTKVRANQSIVICEHGDEGEAKGPYYNRVADRPTVRLDIPV